MRVRSSLLLALLAATTATGCSVDNDYAVTVTWLINGTAPSDSLCRDQGVESVRFTVLGPGDRRTIEAPCTDRLTLDDGYAYGAFDSTPSFEYGVRYNYRVEMLDRAGRPLPEVSYEDQFTVYAEDYTPFVLAPLELFSPLGSMAALTAAWGIEGRAASPNDCDRLGATTVAIDVASSTDFDFEQSVEVARADCADGLLETVEGVLAEGEYNVRYVALDADDDLVQEVRLEDEYYAVDRPGTLDLTGVDFDL
ncbi:MAG TPA: hypothetical protein VFZ61_11005 [Polyangiales bacterium]